jgi:lipopolysaccharide biosynthesis glycosyltransferase
VAALPEVKPFTRAMWFRILLPELLPDVDRVLYLDVDTIVTAPLTPLWETDISGHNLAAVTNVVEPWRGNRAADLGLPGPESYFNSGVLLLNLAELRATDAIRQLRECVAQRGDELIWPDQDALNLVLGDRRLALHPRWNCMNIFFWLPEAKEMFGEEVLADAMAHPGIRHFEGPSVNKPWHVGCEAAGRELYFAHRRAGPWPRVRRIGRFRA